MRIFEVVSGSKSDFFGDEDEAKKFLKDQYAKGGGLPFIDKHFVERPDEFAALLNEKVTARRSGQATGASRQTHISANEDSTTHGH